MHPPAARRPRFVFIYGPPGVGKLTVAEALAARTGFKVYHNHLSIDAVEPVFEFGTQAFWLLVHGIREATVEAAAREGIDLIFTNVYEHPESAARVTRLFEVVEQQGGSVAPVQLSCAMEELERRIASARRAEMRKLASVEAWRRAVAGREVTSVVPGRDSLRIDNTHVSPEAAAELIVRHYGLG
jgi:hypothetical protein